MRLIFTTLILVGCSSFAQQPRRNCGEPSLPLPPRPDPAGLPLATGDRSARLAAAVRTGVIGWSFEGEGYELACDEVATNCGVMLMRSRAWRQGTMGTFLHRESALPWRGSRVELRAEVRTGEVKQHAVLLVSAQDEQGRVLSTARSEPLTGTSSFAWRSVALDVPAGAERLVVGFELVGRGALFLREIQFDDAQLLSVR